MKDPRKAGSDGGEIDQPEHERTFKQPSTIHNAEGSVRRVGFELEFSGLSLDQTLDAIEVALGGERQPVSVAECQLEVDGLGPFQVELDWRYLKLKAAETDPESDWIALLSQAAALLVPMEVVCPPIEMTRLDALNPMVDSLRHSGAMGTQESLLAAYGVHINPEIPSPDAETLFAYLRAFALLQWWLVESQGVDPTRKASPYVDLYPESYVAKLLSRQTPSLECILEDYLEHNATRNRSLDMLPLLAELDADRVRRAVDDPRIKARPTFHYRLPDCHIERPDWSLADPWNGWWVVEELAQRPEDLDALGAAFMEAARPLLGVNRTAWVEYMDRWLKDRGLA
ncbi:amidoligase family protein [Imhoffiella purpurea]|uniref:Amidoligase enzyme n=1 Tax=Imhoffiella purpurea TaxID=1249627 RepID=W9VAP3_9GAMM|nr:amidoligase family protein [Imhoffiella purpurea]EXJ13981.1 hypothetical protein D779_3181 [Imhoffiella purpurea]